VIRLCALLFGLAAPAAAQQLNCANPTTQYELTGCASQAYEAADGDLNLAWGMARDMAKRLDASASEYGGPQDNFAILLDAQRKWIAFRDAACDAEALLARGGTMQNQLFFDCLTRLTRARTEDLRYFGDAN